MKVLIITGRSRGVCEGPRGEQTITKTFSCVILRCNRKRFHFQEGITPFAIPDRKEM